MKVIKNKITLSMLFSFLMMTVSPTVNAASRNDEETYGMAGCGLGSLIIHQDSRGAQLAVWLFNQIYSNQTFGISSGTSNCVAPPSVREAEQKVYFKANIATISRFAAQGSARDLDGLAEVFGCSGDAERLRLVETSRNNYGQIFASQDPEHVLQQYVNLIKADDILQRGCSRVI